MPLSVLDIVPFAVIAHRGGAKLNPENSMAAFDAAAAMGVDGFECDVHLSRDNDVVVIHDATLDRTTDARGPVRALTASELARVDTGGGGVPRLAALLERHPSVPMVVEIKGDDPAVAARVLGVVADARAGGRVIVAGFSSAVLREVRRLAPDISTSASSQEARSAVTRSHFWLKPKPEGYHVLQVPLRLKGREVLPGGFVRRAVRAGVPVHVWIIDDPADMRRLAGWGVTGIISDRPDVALAARKDFGTA